MLDGFRRTRSISVLITAATMCTAMWCSAQENSQSQVTSSIKKSNGLETIEFDTLTGTVEVNLPDDLSATDTISGTVLVESKGETKEEIAQNEDTLRGYVVEISQTQEVKEPEPPAKPASPPAQHKPPITHTTPPTISHEPPTIHVVPRQIPHYTCQIPRGRGGIRVIIRNRGGEEVCNQPVTCNPQPPRCPPVTIPTQGTCGEPLRIAGPSDGRVSISRVALNGRNCPILAESPRQEICQTPNNTTGPCTIERTECGRITRGTITMKPPRIISAARPIDAAIPAIPKKYSFRRTGPFVTQDTPSCYVGEGSTVNITESAISWTGPQSIKGDPMVSSTINFQTPPEIITVGDKFNLTASTSGDPRVNTQASMTGDYSWVKPVNNIRSVTLHQGYGEPSGTFQFEVQDYMKMLDDALKEHPEYADKLTPEVKQRMPLVQFYCPGRVNVKIQWKYIPIEQK